MNTKPFRYSLILTLAMLVAAATSCSSLDISEDTYKESPLDKDAWLAKRAELLNLSEQEAAQRDQSLDKSGLESVKFDDHLLADAARRWRTSCAGCHGIQGKLKNVIPQEPAPRKLGTFGMTMGFTFGGDKMRAGIFKVIKNGKKRPDGTISMTGWKETLSNEQTWGLVYFIEKGL